MKEKKMPSSAVLKIVIHDASSSESPCVLLANPKVHVGSPR